MRDSFIENLTQAALADESIILLTGDLGFGVFDNFRNILPNQFINAGIAEQNMAGLAAGLASEGLKVFMYSIGNFPSMRCLEQIRNDICYHDLNVTIVCVGAGFSYGQLGFSHFATEDIAICRAIPNLRVITPYTRDIRESFRLAMSDESPKYLRLDKSFVVEPSLPCTTNSELVDVYGSDAPIAVVCIGGVVSNVMKAVVMAQNEQEDTCIQVIVIKQMNPMNSSLVLNFLANKQVIVVVEEHVQNGGLSEAISYLCIKNQVFPSEFYSENLKDEFSHVVGDQDFLCAEFGLDAPSLSEKFRLLTAKWCARSKLEPSIHR